MKIELGDKTFEFTVDGKPLESEDEVLGALVALGGTFFPFAVVTGNQETTRAMAFVFDAAYANAMLTRMESELGPDETMDLLALDGADA